VTSSLSVRIFAIKCGHVQTQMKSKILRQQVVLLFICCCLNVFCGICLNEPIPSERRPLEASLVLSMIRRSFQAPMWLKTRKTPISKPQRGANSESLPIFLRCATKPHSVFQARVHPVIRYKSLIVQAISARSLPRASGGALLATGPKLG